MKKLKMCRICLVEDVSMYEVANKDLQDMYEKMTDVPFATEDCRPMLACFFCYTKLNHCCLFQRKCLKAEEVFTQMLNGGYEQIPLQLQGEMEFCGGFIKTPIEHMSIDGVPAVGDVKVDIGLEEYLGHEVKVEYPEEGYLYQEYIPNIAEDEVPLMMFKTEVEEEQEVPEESTRTPVAMKPELDIRKAKLEDKITDKQKKNGPSDFKIICTTRNNTTKCFNKFRKPIANGNITIPGIVNTIIKKDKKINKESLKKKNDKEVINTAVGNPNNSNIGNFRCRICSHKSFNIDDHIKHERLCTKKNIHKCDVCQKTFNRKQFLDRHMLTHTGERPYQCDICPRSFSTNQNLQSHIRKHTGERPYKCGICQRSYTYHQNWKSHMRTHTGEKPYKCDICQRSFTVNANLKSHIRMHTGEIANKCDICQRTFCQKSVLNRHMRIHTGEKPYKCDICQLRFTRKDFLSDHIRKH